MPSHGKHEQRQPPPTWSPAALCRSYDEWVDEAAKAVTGGEGRAFEDRVAAILVLGGDGHFAPTEGNR